MPYTGAYGAYGSQRQVAQGYGALPAYSYCADQEADQQQVHIRAHDLRPIEGLHHLSCVLLLRKDGLDGLPSASLYGQSTQIDHILLDMTIQIRHTNADVTVPAQACV